MLEEYDNELKFNQKRVSYRHNLHNKIAGELRKRSIIYTEEFYCK